AGGKVPLHDVGGFLVGAGDPRAARLADAVERVLVDFVGDRIVDDVAVLHAVVLAAQPGVDPERFDPHDLLLVVGHAAGDVRHVEDGGVGLRFVNGFPAAEPLVLLAGDDDGLFRIVASAGDLPFERFLVRPLEVPQRVGTGAAD